MDTEMKFEFTGIDPESEFKKLLTAIAEKIHFNSPSDAALRFALKKTQDAVQASCRIASQAGVFVAETVSDNPVQAVKQLERKIIQQLERWKRHRFSADSTRAASGV